LHNAKTFNIWSNEPSNTFAIMDSNVLKKPSLPSLSLSLLKEKRTKIYKFGSKNKNNSFFFFFFFFLNVKCINKRFRVRNSKVKSIVPHFVNV
jgi:hypothetical protein